MSDNPAYADWKKALRLEYTAKDTQSELRMIITQKPEQYLEKVTKEEMAISGLLHGDDTLMNESGNPATQEEINAMNERVEKRMLTESPALIEHKLTYRGGILEPDFTLHEKDRREKEW